MPYTLSCEGNCLPDPIIPPELCGTDAANFLLRMHDTYNSIARERRLAETLDSVEATIAYKNIIVQWIRLLNMWASGEPCQINYDADRDMELAHIPMPVPVFDLYTMFTNAIREKRQLGPKEALLARNTSAIMGKWVVSAMAALPISGMLRS